jgi:hypothetical protein
MNHRRIFFNLYFFTVLLISAEEATYYIREINFNITGRTKESVLLGKLDISPDKTFSSIAEIDAWRMAAEQILQNERTLDSVSIIFSLDTLVADADNTPDDDRIPLSISIEVTDSANIIVLPYPRYSSSSGLRLEARFRDYNFLCTMNELEFDVGFIRDAQKQKSLLTNLNLTLPFELFNLDWYFITNNNVLYHFKKSSPLDYKNKSAIALDVPVSKLLFSFGYEQTFAVNTIPVFDYDAKYDYSEYLYPSIYTVNDLIYPQNYFYSSPFSTMLLHTGLNIPFINELLYSLTVKPYIVYGKNNTPSKFANGFYLHINNRLSSDNIKWQGNFQNGFSFSLLNEDIINFKTPALSIYSLTFDFIMQKVFADTLGISLRLGVLSSLLDNAHYLAAGGFLRGIADSAFDAQTLLFLNFDMPVKLFTVKPSTWTNKDNLKKFYKVFNVEVHVSPVLDLAFYRDAPDKNNTIDSSFLAATGFELLFYSLTFRSVYLRTSFTFPVYSKTKGGYEIFLGLGRHY